MIKRNLIITCGLSDIENDSLNNVISPYHFNLKRLTNIEDLANINLFINYINLDVMEETLVNETLLYLNEVQGNLAEFRIFTQHNYEINKHPNIKIYPSFMDYEEEKYEDLKNIIANLRKQENKISNYEKCHTVLELIKKYKSVTVTELNTLTGYKALEIRRYIEVLRLMGEPIACKYVDNHWITNYN